MITFLLRYSSRAVSGIGRSIFIIPSVSRISWISWGSQFTNSSPVSGCLTSNEACSPNKSQTYHESHCLLGDKFTLVLKKCLKVEFHYKVLFLRFYIIYMPFVWISHVFHWYLWPCPLTARKFAKVTYGQRSLWRHLRSRKLTANRGLSQEEKKDRNEAKTYWFSKPVSFNVECARPVKTARWKFLSSQLLFAHTRSVSRVARD